jgi:hypothetical protein
MDKMLPTLLGFHDVNTGNILWETRGRCPEIGQTVLSPDKDSDAYTVVSVCDMISRCGGKIGMWVNVK